VLRHAQAVPKGPANQDHERQLTKEGIVIARSVLLLAKQLGMNIESIVSSSFKRAIQTAQIAKEVFQLTEIIVNDVLEPNSTPFEVSAYLATYQPTGKILLVSHEPLVREIVQNFVGRELNLVFPPSSIARIDLRDKSEGKLVWLLSSDSFTQKIE
jgi:phosphohistidine phosphatase SixA